MVNIQKSGDSAIKFTFTDNDRYLYDGEITVPLNSLILVLDESDMVVIKKVDGDVFLTFLIDNTNFSSKADLESWFKENACGSTGGGGVTSGEVQTMIDESISGKADTSDVQEIASDVSTVSGDVNTLSGSVESIHSAVSDVVGDVQTLSGQVQGDETILTGHTANTDIHVTASDKQNWNNKSDFSGSYNDLTDKPTIPVVPTNVSAFNNDAGYVTQTNIDAAVSGKVNTTDFNTYSASTDARISEDEEVTSAALNELNDALDDKADTTAVTESINAAVSGKQDTLIAGSGITIDSANTISCTVTGGGATYSAGRGIAIDTGNTISLNVGVGELTGASTGNIAIGGYIYGNASNNNTNTVSGSNTLGTNTIGSYNTIQGQSFGGILSNATIIGTNNLIQKTSSTSSSFFGGVIIGDENKLLAQSLNGTSILIGKANSGDSSSQYAFGIGNKLRNYQEFTIGKFNNSVSGSTDADKTFFSIGNGTSTAATHNAFEIRRNGDIYITSGGTDIKLQDNLGGGGGLPESAFTTYTASTDARLAEDEEVTAAGLNALNDVLDDKADASAFTAHTADTTIHTTSAEKTSWNGAVTALGGLKLVQISQSDYDNLQNKDASTLYIIT